MNLFSKSTQTNPGGRNSSSYQHCERKPHVKNISVCWDFQKQNFILWKFFSVLQTSNKIFWDGSINVILGEGRAATRGISFFLTRCYPPHFSALFLSQHSANCPQHFKAFQNSFFHHFIMHRISCRQVRRLPFRSYVYLCYARPCDEASLCVGNILSQPRAARPIFVKRRIDFSCRFWTHS